MNDVNDPLKSIHAAKDTRNYRACSDSHTEMWLQNTSTFLKKTSKRGIETKGRKPSHEERKK